MKDLFKFMHIFLFQLCITTGTGHGELSANRVNLEIWLPSSPGLYWAQLSAGPFSLDV